MAKKVSKGKKQYLTVGAMLLGKEKDMNGKDSYYIKLADNVEITVNGVQFTGEFLKVQRPTDKFDFMLNAGKLDEAEHAAKVAEFDKGGKLSFIKFELVAVQE